MILTPTYHAFEMCKVHQDTTHIPVEVETPEYEFADEEIPAVSVSASKAKDGVVYVSMVNTHARDNVVVACELKGIDATKVAGRILTADVLDAHNTFDKPEVVKPAEFKNASVGGGALKVDLPPHSVVVLSLTK
jgi:alpha-N-arabinofuranosidase